MSKSQCAPITLILPHAPFKPGDTIKIGSESLLVTNVSDDQVTVTTVIQSVEHTRAEVERARRASEFEATVTEASPHIYCVSEPELERYVRCYPCYMEEGR